MKITDYGPARYSNYYQALGQKRAAGRSTADFFDAAGTEVEGQAAGDQAKTSARTGSGDRGPILSTAEKLMMDRAYEEELEDARINDPEKYERMVAQRKSDIAKSFSQIEALAGKNMGQKVGSAPYKGVMINFNFELKHFSVGDMSSGRIIHVGRLSNGYSFSFNRDNINDVSAILDLFSPEDVKKIMEAITIDNIALSMEQEAEAAEDEAIKTVDDIENAADIMKSGKTDQNERYDASASADSGDSKTLEGAGKKEKESEGSSSEVVENPDGSRTLVITIRTGGREIITKMELAPAKSEADQYTPKDPDQSKPYSSWKNDLAQAAYEAGFLYVQSEA